MYMRLREMDNHGAPSPLIPKYRHQTVARRTMSLATRTAFRVELTLRKSHVMEGPGILFFWLVYGSSLMF